MLLLDYAKTPFFCVQNAPRFRNAGFAVFDTTARLSCKNRFLFLRSCFQIMSSDIRSALGFEVEIFGIVDFWFGL